MPAGKRSARAGGEQPGEAVPPNIRRLLDQVRGMLAASAQAPRFSDETLRDRNPVPAVPVENSVTRNFLVCLETGIRLVMLGRHLRERLKMTPEEYRRKWGLPPEYPMVAATYRQRRAARREAASDRRDYDT